ncbi:MAG: EAL domain-containing protein [Actinomycetota bacterium]|nr:EAL domain-containing protein [Actinomycetota bacterium]
MGEGRGTATRSDAGRPVDTLDLTDATLVDTLDLTDPARARRQVEGLVVERAHQRAALDALQVALVIADADLRVLLVNAAAERALGGRPSEMRTDHLAAAGYEVLREDGSRWPALERPLQAAALEGTVTERALMGLRRDGVTRWFSTTGRPLFRQGDPRPYAGLCTLTDVTRERARSEALRESEARFRLLAEHASDVIVRADLEGTCLYCSPSARPVLGIPPERLVGRGLVDLVHPDDRGAARRLLRRLLVTGEPQQLRHRAATPDGRVLWMETVGRTVPGPEGAREVQTSSRDVTSRVEAERRLARLALTDPLTGLANRAGLLQRLDDLLETGAPVALLFLDLDRFKVVNDSLGHAAGDELLRTVAVRLGEVCGRDDLAGRLGGDEFVLVAPDRDQQGALALAEAVGAALAEPIEVSGSELVVTCSTGIVLAPEGGSRRADAMLREADISMYQAKGRGRATVVLWDERFGSAATQRLETERDLRAALEGAPRGGSLILHYQPQVELATGRVAGVEVLVRWQHPSRGLLPPSAFLPVADDSGLVVELGRQVLERAVAQVAAWRRLPGCGELALSLNVSAQELHRPERVRATAAVLAAAGMPPGALTVEVLESVLLDAEGAVEAALADYAAIGVRLALDDFGTGSSSLLHLRQVPVDTVKVDRAFVAGLGSSRRDEAIVRALRALAVELGMRCVAEGVEEPRQQDWLTAQGVGLAQGFLLSRPLPPGEVEPLLLGQPR